MQTNRSLWTCFALFRQKQQWEQKKQIFLLLQKVEYRLLKTIFCKSTKQNFKSNEWICTELSHLEQCSENGLSKQY